MAIGLAKKIVGYLLKEKIINNVQIEIYQYGIELLISSFTNILWVIFLGIIFHEILLAFVYVIILATVRTQIGGYHAADYSRCFLLYTLSFLIVIILVNLFSIIGVGAVDVCLCMVGILLIIYIFAPVLHCKEMDPNDRCTAKRKGLLRTLFWLFIMWICWGVNIEWSYSILAVLILSTLFMIIELIRRICVI